jgi:hypothetical protein
MRGVERGHRSQGIREVARRRQRVRSTTQSDVRPQLVDDPRGRRQTLGLTREPGRRTRKRRYVRNASNDNATKNAAKRRTNP